MSFSYRKLSLPEMALIQKVGRETYEPYYPHIWKSGGLDWYMERCFGKETLRTELPDANIEYWLAEDESGLTVGILKLVLLKPVLHYPIKNALYLEKIYLMPNFYGKGYGQTMIGFVKDRAVALGRQAIWLIVMKSGPIQAYERAGFQTVGEVQWDFPLMKEAERGGWVMVCLP